MTAPHHFIPNTDDDLAEMLSAIGVRTFEDLLSPMPSDVRQHGGLDLPDPRYNALGGRHSPVTLVGASVDHRWGHDKGVLVPTVVVCHKYQWPSDGHYWLKTHYGYFRK